MFRTPSRSPDRVVLDYGIRYEIYSPSPNVLTAPRGFLINGFSSRICRQSAGLDTTSTGAGLLLAFKSMEGPNTLHLHAGGGITNNFHPHIWQTMSSNRRCSLRDLSHITAAVGAPILYGFQITSAQLPTFYTPTDKTSSPVAIPKVFHPNTVLT